MKNSKKKTSEEPKIDNAAIIQYMTKNGDMKVLAFSDYDLRELKRRVAIHMGTKKILSVQFYYNIRTNKDVHLIQKGVILE